MFDFEQSYGTHPDIFVDTWARWKLDIEKVLSQHGGLQDFATTFDEEVDRFLMLLKLLPIRAQGRVTVPKRLNFNETVDRLIVYSKVLKTEWFYQLNIFICLLIFYVFVVWETIVGCIETGKFASIYCHDWLNAKKNHTLLYCGRWKVHKCNLKFSFYFVISNYLNYYLRFDFFFLD